MYCPALPEQKQLGRRLLRQLQIYKNTLKYTNTCCMAIAIALYEVGYTFHPRTLFFLGSFQHFPHSLVSLLPVPSGKK